MTRPPNALLLIVLTASACSGTIAVPPETTGGTRVLFIGNSLTYANDLPLTVAAIAASAGDSFHVEMAAASNVAIIDHLNGATDAVQRMKSKWDFVVLQQGPTTTALCRDSLVLWTKLFDPHIRAAGATPALFMTWPIGADWSRMPLVRQSFQESAQAVDGIFLPAGEAWRLIHEADPSIAVYGPDNFHPSEVGSFLAALTIYERLSGRDVRSIPLRAFTGRNALALPEATIRKLQNAAHDANSLYPPGQRAVAVRAASPPSSSATGGC